jgi:hypothetical protein
MTTIGTQAAALTTVLASAHDVLARAEKEHIAPRVLARFAKKVRLAEKAAQFPADGASSDGATQAGLRAILARAEASCARRGPTPEQARALEELRARVTGIEPIDTSKLVASLHADVEQLEGELARGAKKRAAEAGPKSAKPMAKAGRKARPSRSPGSRREPPGTRRRR